MALNGHFTVIFCQVQVQDLLIYLYGQRHDIYGSDPLVRRAGSLYHKSISMVFCHQVFQWTQLYCLTRQYN